MHERPCLQCLLKQGMHASFFDGFTIAPLSNMYTSFSEVGPKRETTFFFKAIARCRPSESLLTITLQLLIQSIYPVISLSDCWYETEYFLPASFSNLFQFCSGQALLGQRFPTLILNPISNFSLVFGLDRKSTRLNSSHSSISY